MKFAPADGEVGSQDLLTAENLGKAEEFLQFCFSFANKRCRKNKSELEAYRIALGSKASWAAEKKYRGESVFSENRELPWYEQPEPSVEQKQDKLRQAERDVKWENSFRGSFRGGRGGGSTRGSGFASGFSRGPKRTRWDTPSASRSGQHQPALALTYEEPDKVPAQLQHPPQQQDQRLCFNCEQPGHLARFCRNPPVIKKRF